MKLIYSMYMEKISRWMFTYHHRKRHSKHEDISLEVIWFFKKNLWCVVAICAYNIVLYNLVREHSPTHAEINYSEINL